MNTYSIYWIKEEIANHYFHKSDILYRFLRSYQKDDARKDLIMQFDYITHNFSYEKLISHMKGYYNNTKAIVHIDGSRITICQNGSCISLLISKKHLKFRCDALQDAEQLLFPMLRRYQRLLFITGKKDFGWISPVLYMNKQDINLLLYSNS
ncbi:sporulation inhibitor of replication protein SirA [Virgibacillus kimchii]